RRAPDPVPAGHRGRRPAREHEGVGPDDLRLRARPDRPHAPPPAAPAGRVGRRQSRLPSRAMTRNLLALTVAALTLAGVAAASTTATPGVSSSTITIGSSGPLTGEAAAAAGVLKGAEGYFKYVNARGGVNGRKIDFKYLDDAYDPA